jgi:hypothetical protein
MSGVDHIGELGLIDGSRLVLTDNYSSPVGVSNLACFGPDGVKLWSAELRDPNAGHYVAMKTEGGRLFANSFDAYYVELDAATGRIIAEQFTK